MLLPSFENAFSRLFVYNILFEDSEVDGRYLNLNENSRVLGISAAGCGLASMVRFHPEHIDAVDINHHHLSLAALKMTAARDLKSHGLLYDLFGHGWLSHPEPTIRALCASLPPSIQSYWRKHHARFEKTVYGQGLTALMLQTLRKQVGLGTAFMHDFVTQAPEERARTIRRLAEPVMKQRLVRELLASPLTQFALGVNDSQRDRMLGSSGDMADFMLGHLERVAQTDCETNWFAWYAAAGHYNHSHPEATPPYLRRSAHQASREAPTTFGFHHRSIFDVLGAQSANTWSHYSLCDAVDWFPPAGQKNLLEEILRTARPGATVLMRSVQDENIIESCELGHRFQYLEAQSRLAIQEERTCQYKRVDFFQVHA